MTSTTEDHKVPEPHDVGGGRPSAVDPETVVISGVSTLMPDSSGFKEFADKLYDKINMVKSGEPRWRYKYPEMSQHNGTIPDIDRFDAQFFMVHHHLSQNMDAMARKLLEQSYQAVFDAGVCPSELSGKPIGVFIASGLCESEKACASDLYLGIIGCNRAMFANRISYYLNLKGPSMLVDGESAGTAVALEKAYASIMSGHCEAAIVGGTKLLLHPQSSLHYHKLMPLSKDGNVKSYDMNADGHSISEAITVIFLQKYKDAKRVYAAIRHIQTSFSGCMNTGEHQTYGPYREPAVMTKFLKEFYVQAKVSPSQVEYVEGFGSGIPDADKAELIVIDEVFCKNRPKPLPVGSVMSNAGFTDAVSCLTSVIKVLLGYQKGILAANINYSTPRTDISAIAEGRIRIVNEHEQFGRGLAAINNFSITGINCHVLLEGIYKPKDISQLKSDLPQLVLASGRQESSVQKILDDAKCPPLDPEKIALLRNIHGTRIPKHLARGFGIYSSDEGNETITLKEEVDYYDDARKPLWFVYSGMGSQWTGMGAHLMKIPIFANAIYKCHKVLEPKGIDLIKVLTASDSKLFENILNSFVGIAAVQIGLTDVLQAVGLVPDNIIGHSVGELGCAYADGCLTAEEMILMAYSRGLVSIQTPFIRGSMAAVGIGFKQISKFLPPEIEVACHNGPDSCTISGPADNMKQFVAQLIAKGIFAKEVPCSNIAYHSRYIAEAGPGLLNYLKEVIKTPKARSKRWLSTSVPRDKWNERLANYSSAEYHTNNLLSPVLFEETIRLVPSNAVLVEIAPHGLLQAILKRSLPNECKNIPLTIRGHLDNATFVLEAIGKLYMEGYDIDVSPLYPRVDFPVSTETHVLSHLVEWMHSEKLKVCQYVCVKRTIDSVYKPIVYLYDEEYRYLSGNIVDGRKDFPFSGALVLVWKMLAMMLGKQRDQVTVQFKELHLYVEPLLSAEKPLRLVITLQRGSGRFEVTDENNLVASGHVIAVALFTDLPHLKPEDMGNDTLKLTGDDIYKLLYEKGYQYQNEFRSIKGANMDLTQAEITWNDNWVTFIDAVLQLNVLKQENKGISQPKYIKRICIDVKQHALDIASSRHNNGTIKAVFSEVHNSIRCGGLTIEHTLFKNKPTFQRQYSALKEMTFTPFSVEISDIATSLYIFLQIIVENINKNYLNVCYVSEIKNSCLFEEIRYLLISSPEIKIDLTILNMNEIMKNSNFNYDLVFLDNVFHDKKVFENLYSVIPSNTFMITLGDKQNIIYPTSIYHLICTRGSGSERLELAKWRPHNIVQTTAAFSVRNVFDLEHLKTMKSEFSGQHKLFVLGSYPPIPGLKKLIKEWRCESKNVYLVMINDKCEDYDDLDFPSFDLVFNILNNGTWGGEYYIPLQKPMLAFGKIPALQIAQFGNLNTLQWVDKIQLSGQGIPIKVHYAGLNVYDAKRAAAEISINDNGDHEFGMDFSGVTKSGDRVMGLIKNGATSTEVFAQKELIWPVPNHWSLADAATVPLSYCLALYCLTIRTQLFRGLNVLIHGGSGALGQAAISICLAHQCNVYTTVSNVHKRRLLRKIFPDLPVDHIGSSRDTSFKDMVLNATKGEGCHIIISSVSGELKQVTLSCCAASGITLDTVLLQNHENFSYGMFNMTKSRSFATIDYSSIFENNNLDDMKALQLKVSEGIVRGYVRPLTRVVYSPQDAPRAIRLLLGSRHRGRVLLNLQEPVPAVEARMFCSPNSSFLILCDLEDFGLQWADRLISNGARKLFIHHQQPTAFLEYKYLAWKKQGIKVHISTESLNRKGTIASILKDCNHLAPIEGIFVIRNGSNSQTLVNNLDTVSRELFPNVRYFAVIHEGETKNILVNRVQCGFPSLFLNLHNLEKFNTHLEDSDVHRKLKWSGALDGIERALCSEKQVVVAYAQPLQRKSLFEEIETITGFKIQHCEEDNTLELTGVDEGKAQEIRNILEEKFDIVMTKVSVLRMTVSEFRKLQNNLTEVKQQQLLGIEGYINFIENDELLANCNVIMMRTLTHSSELKADEFDDELTYLCIVPGLEGNYWRFSTLCERLKIPALVLQPGFDVVDKTIAQMAKRLVNVMKTKQIVHNHFYLLGYEFGILIALEMASQMENEGLTGTVYCLGGTPEEICAVIHEQFGDIDSENLENQLIEHVYFLVTGSNSNELTKEIKTLYNWEEKAALFISMIREKSPYTNGYVRAMLEIYHKRIILAKEYVFLKQKLRSKIVILKARTHKKPEGELSDYDDNIHVLNKTLPHVPEDLMCSAVVNKYLEPDLLDDFYNSNRCETSQVNECDEVVINYIDV